MKRKTILLSVIILFFLGCKSERKKFEDNLEDENNVSSKLDEYFLTLKTLDKFNGVVLIEKKGVQGVEKTYRINLCTLVRIKKIKF